jgi:hypothetical protein
MVLLEPFRQTLLIENWRRFVNLQTRRHQKLITLRTLENLCDGLLAPLYAHHPRPIEKWRFMSNMLTVCAAQIGNPIANFICVKCNNGTLHN